MSFDHRRPLIALSVACLLVASPAAAQGSSPAPPSLGLLKELSASVEALTQRVSASVVQVLVTGYGPIEKTSRSNDADVVIGRQRSIGSGAIIDPDGYIITNAHVVAGARQVRVVLHRDAAVAGPVGSLASEDDQTFDARIIGTATDIDLALLKIDATGLRALPLADYDAIRQGELVFAFGSPEGLRNSITMGLVSAVARQLDPDDPAFYIQTDAPINPGNSGGPLVNVNSELVGLNTFILSESGGSEGLGFAIPSAIIASVYPQLRKYGHLHRGVTGFFTQSITPALSAGLGLSRSSGVMVSDVLPDSPAGQAGVHVTDIVTTINGTPVSSVPMLALELSRYAAGDVVTLGLLRGTTTLSISVPVAARPHPIDGLVALADPKESAVPRLGIVGLNVAPSTAALLPELRLASGVLVLARTEASSGNEVQLVAGDVIHAVNTAEVRNVEGLRRLVDAAAAVNSEVVLQVERNRQLLFVTCHID